MTYRNPIPTVDTIIELINRPGRPIILIERQNPPFGWAIPGGFVDYGESVEIAARREAKEETSLEIELIEQFYVYSEPKRDPCLLYTSPSPRDLSTSRMPSSA